MQAVILAAGQGLRLRPFTEHHPKPLIPIADKVLIEYTLESLPDSITEIIIVIGYLGEQIKAHLGNSWQGKPIQYVEQDDLLGTGDAIARAKSFVEQNFLVVNGDDLYAKADLTKLLEHPLSILAWESTIPHENGLKCSEAGLLIDFDANSALINSGAYHLNKQFFDEPLAEIAVHGKTEYSLPHTLTKIAKREPVVVVKATHWFPVGTPAQHQFANRYYREGHNPNS